ncbi:unnamed protein product [Mytilus coruscus]|uniref:Exonuclease domain-containing protein n=1 Tax=Mytilus coruscus TaxID=42192 RepID=A0A6J8CWJ9_MYTCO|nr:unnamed protein product [Mytilus coruscus]
MGPDGDHVDIETIPDQSDLELPKRVDIDINEELSVVVFLTLKPPDLMQPLTLTILENLKDHILGFSDTLPLFRVKFPKRKSYSQSSLANNILKTTYNAHNALNDVKILKQLIEVDITKEQLIENSFEVNEIERQLKMFNAKKHLMVSYNGVIKAKIMLITFKTMSLIAAAAAIKVINSSYQSTAPRVKKKKMTYKDE